MNKKVKWLYLVISALGAALIAAGRLLEPLPVNKTVHGLCFGVGAALFALFLGKFVDSLIVSKTENERFARLKNIEVNDERNVRLRERVGSKTNLVMVYFFSVLILALSFMGESLAVILLVASGLLLELGLTIGLTAYYSKRM
jgi:hypothetical protein